MSGPEPKEATSDGRIADNIVYFARDLAQSRHAGRAGLGQGRDRGGPGRRYRLARRFLLDAARCSGVAARGSCHLRRGLPAVLEVARADRKDAGDASRRWPPDNREKQKPRAAENRVSQAMFAGHQKNQPVQEIPEIEVDARFTFSGNEVLRGKDFAQMNAAEMADAKKAIAQLRLPFDMVGRDASNPIAHGRRIDPRAMMRSAARTGGELILPKFRSAARGLSAAGRACRHFGFDEPVHAHLPAFPPRARRRSAGACIPSSSAPGLPI